MDFELLNKKLEKEIVYAKPLGQTDMGLQYAYWTKEMVGETMGGIGMWPIHKVINDIEGYLKVAFVDGFGEDLTKEYKEHIQKLKDTYNKNGYVYCLFDPFSRKEDPMIFEDLVSIKKAFVDYYCVEISKWEDMDNEIKKEWIDYISYYEIDCFEITEF